MLTKAQFTAQLPTSELLQSYVKHCGGDVEAGYELYVQRFRRWNSLSSVPIKKN